MIMTILLTIGLGTNYLLVSEIKIMRNMNNSVIAFYAAETGIEKTLYLDNIVIPEGGSRGLCNICNIATEWDTCTIWGDDCDLISCSNCTCRFTDVINGKEHSVEIQVTDTSTIIKSVGTYRATRRAIQVTR
ncbi:pilus assembly PilX N-terminal domain-containing protein [Patescibacteria group bacterium]|nr:pilus assembly PilX N-terminal domain-containing protein [Patescibacteria group bacterium]